MENSLDLLKKYWQTNGFRPLQKEIMEHYQTGQDTIALLPTGGGKSLCYQLPALMQEGITLVISPLISLMQDQVNQLKDDNARLQKQVDSNQAAFDWARCQAHINRLIADRNQLRSQLAALTS